MNNLTALDQFWHEAVRSHPQLVGKHYFEAFCFGESEKMANELAELALSGVKTATSSLLWSLEQQNKPFLQVGDFSIVTNWEKVPVCVTETIELRIVPFNEVDAEVAYDYGEGDRTLSWWKENMWDYYVQECAVIGRQAAEDMPLLCERFRVVYP
jgi:uncharacterized protein YhfF